jgi:hypothetical protein
MHLLVYLKRHETVASERCPKQAACDKHILAAAAPPIPRRSMLAGRLARQVAPPMVELLL